MADAVSGDVFGFLLSIAKEQPVATSLVPMGFGFLLLIAEQARKTVRPAAVHLIYVYLGVTILLVVATFIFSVVQSNIDQSRQAEAMTNMRNQLERATKEKNDAQTAADTAKREATSSLADSKAALEEAQRQKERAGSLQQQVDQGGLEIRLRQNRSLARIYSDARSLLETLTTKALAEADASPTLKSMIQNLSTTAREICQIAMSEIIAGAGGAGPPTQVAYKCD
jgi:hypothetical protein